MLPVLDTLLDEIFKSYVKHWVRFDNHRSSIPKCRKKERRGQSPWNVCNAHCASQRTAFSQRTQSVMRASQGPAPQPTFFQVRWGSCQVRFPHPNSCALKASKVRNLNKCIPGDQSDALLMHSYSSRTTCFTWVFQCIFVSTTRVMRLMPAEKSLPSLLVKCLNPPEDIWSTHKWEMWPTKDQGLMAQAGLKCTLPRNISTSVRMINVGQIEAPPTEMHQLKLSNICFLGNEKGCTKTWVHTTSSTFFTWWGCGDDADDDDSVGCPDAVGSSWAKRGVNLGRGSALAQH